MKKINIFYWICTGMIAAALGIGSVFDVLSHPEAVKVMTDLGYPAYLCPFLGVAKLLGLAVILIPGYPRLKEWAYAGLAFDLIGALYSHMAAGEPVTHWIGVFIPALLLAGSYLLYHKKLNPV